MAPKRSRYSRHHRLREGALAVIKGVGKRLATEHLNAHTAPSLLPYCRVAVVVGKHSHGAIERNYLRRQLRELARQRLIPECSGMDVILRALPGAYDVGFDKLADEMSEIKTQLVTTPE